MVDTQRSRGLFSSLRGLVATGVATLQTRLELLSTELQEEKARVLGLLAYGAAALVLLAAGVVFLAVLLTVLLWDSHRVLALAVFATLFLGAGGLALAMTLRLARSDSRLFAASLAELAQDRDTLEPRE
ncbi:MAG: phage holin family protein [Rhodocyclaceae bacterium]|nr:phage holin family protein [Rhodocyclaceae bacterium]